MAGSMSANSSCPRHDLIEAGQLVIYCLAASFKAELDPSVLVIIPEIDRDIGLQAVTAGEGYFGFGDQVGTTDGSITGFICNWAGPGGSHVTADYAQRQNITLNATTSVFEPTNSAASDIIYAPTTTCLYDGSGSYLYDRDLDGDLSDETSDTVNVNAGETLELDLMVPGGTATTIWDHIVNNRGYNLPSYPN